MQEDDPFEVMLSGVSGFSRTKGLPERHLTQMSRHSKNLENKNLLTKKEREK